MTVVGHGKVGRVSRRSARFIDHLVPSGEGLRSKNMKKAIGYRGSGIGKEGDCA
jgi:hypothetical protein